MANKIMDFFSAKFGHVRARVINGEAWFVGKDVAQALGYKDTKSALQDHVFDDYKCVFTNKILAQMASERKGNESLLLKMASERKGGETPPFETASERKGRDSRPFEMASRRGMTYIKEAGLYQLIFSSKMPEAIDFQRWVFEEVLPNLRMEIIRLEIRENGKKTRRDLTDAIKKFIEYLKARGELDRDPAGWYRPFTDLAKKAANAHDKRDYLQGVIALRLQDAEDKIAAAIEDGMSAGKTHHDIWLDCNKVLNVE